MAVTPSARCDKIRVYGDNELFLFWLGHRSMPLSRGFSFGLPSSSIVSFLRSGGAAHEELIHGKGGSTVDESQSAMADLESCELPTRVAQHHARLLRLGVLCSLSSAFHWNCLMRGYLRVTLSPAALQLYLLMCRGGLPPDCYTMPIVLKAACRLFAVDLGRQLHCSAVKRGLELNEFCESGLICVYAKVGEFHDARKVFEKNSQRRLGSWNAIISGLSQAGRASEAMELFLDLRKSGILPDDVTMVSVASACGSLGDLDLAQQIHKCVLQARRRSPETTILQLQNSLIDMYGKCGRPDLAGGVFSRMRRRDVSSWTAMIMALAVHGRAHEAVDLFRRMISGDGGGAARPNHVTFVAVLTACAHGGMVEEGLEFFRRMPAEFGVEPAAPHYGCVVDMLGRVGRLPEARKMVAGTPAGENSVILGTILGACEKHGHVEVAEWAAAKLAALEPENDGGYVVLSNIYAANGRWDDVARLRRLMRAKSLIKVPAYSAASLPV